MTWILFKKELKYLFSTPHAYLISAVFIFAMGALFVLSLFSFVNASQLPEALGVKVDAMEGLIRPIWGNMNFIFLLLASAVTMRSFAEEKKDQTLDLLLSAPISLTQIVVAKWLAFVTLALFMVSLTLVFPIIATFAGADDYSAMVVGYLGVILNVSAYLALGVFASTLTENQIIAAAYSLVMILFFWLVFQVTYFLPNPLLKDMLGWVSFQTHFYSFLRGVIDTKDLAFYFSFIFFALFLSQKSLDARNW